MSSDRMKYHRKGVIIMIQAFKGDIVYSADRSNLQIHNDSHIIVSNGLVIGIYEKLPQEYTHIELIDHTGSLIIPAFTDMHLHASQYYQRGVGMDKLLLDWLNDYTFPQESSFESMEYAKRAYDLFVGDLIRHGTLHASIFTTVHYDASDYLFEQLEKRGLYAYVGKLNMNQNCPPSLREDTRRSILDTERFILEHQGGRTVKPIITPRFAISCTEELIEGLGKLANTYQVPVQTHLCESEAEMNAVRGLFPDYTYDSEIYLKYGLIGNGMTILAHCIYLQDEDIKIMNEHGCVAVHCPDSNINVTAGLMPAARLADTGMNITLGSDIGGGHDIPIYRAIARAIQVSKIRELMGLEDKRINMAEAFYFATRAGGECFGKIGAFDKDYHFNALVIDDREFQGLEVASGERLERFCYIGDDRNITARYVDGRPIEVE